MVTVCCLFFLRAIALFFVFSLKRVVGIGVAVVAVVVVGGGGGGGGVRVGVVGVGIGLCVAFWRRSFSPCVPC